MAKEIKEMICITCPLGCRMEVEIDNGELTAVHHHSCKRGVEYAHSEFYAPKRMVTATVDIEHGIVHRIPVRTSEPIPTKHIPDLLQRLYALTLQAPLNIGTVVIENFADSGVNVITTRNVSKAA